MSDTILYLIEADAATDAAGTVVTQRFSNLGYRTEPGDSVPNAFYEDVVAPGGTGTITRQLFSGDKTAGSSQVGFGDITLVNTHGGLDGLLTYSFDGRPLVVKTGSPGDSFTSLQPILRATMDQVELSNDEVTITLRDRLYELDAQHQTEVYAGNNILPNGLEGVDDLKGKPKPYMLGKVFNVSAPQVNTSRLVYQLSAGLVNSVDGVYDGGNALTPGALRTLAQFQAGATTLNFTVVAATDIVTTASAHGYATGDAVSVFSGTTLPAPLAATATYFARVLSSTTLTLHTTAAGAVANTGRVDITTTGSGTHNISNNRTAQSSYDWCLDAAGSYFRLGSSPVNEVTCDATQGANAAARTTAQVLKALALHRGVDSGDIDAGDVTALDATSNAEVGLWFADERTTLAAMDEIAPSAGAFFSFDRLGVLRMGQFAAPSGSAVLVIDQTNGADLEKVPNADGQPTYRVTLNHSRNETTQTSGYAAAVSTARRAQLAQEYRSTSAEDTTVLTQYLGAQAISRNTRLVSEAAASTEAARVLALYKVRRDVFRVRVELTPEALLALDLNAVVTLQWDRFGLDAGRLMRVIAGDFDYALSSATLTLWG